jgi:nucleotide-binding universal stress UspA family protein
MYESIVVGTDGSETAQHALSEAVSLAEALGCGLHVVSAYEPMRGVRVEGAKVGTVLPDTKVRTVVEQAAATARVRGLPVTTHTLTGDPAEALLDVAAQESADLIVVGSRGMHGMARMLGSVPNKVSHHARCSVLIVCTDDDASAR